MVTLTADVTEEIKKMAQALVKSGMYKSQSEVVRDALRQLAYRYNVESAPSIEEVRGIFKSAGKKTKKTLSQTVREIRNE